MKTTPKDFFLQLGVTVALYIGAGSLINLVFTIIDAVFPNPSIYNNYYYSSPISWAVATLIIIYPVYILLSWLLNRDFVAFPEKRTFAIRKWLSYITLFVSGGVIVGDLIFLLFRFLGGEIVTTGFVLKVVSIFIIAAGIFAYYISDLRDTTSQKRNKIYAIGLGVIILALIIWGFSIFGSPSKQRQLRADSQKITDLQSIQWQIVNYWQQKQALPASLSLLNDPISGFVVPVDQDNNEAYEYRKISDKKFELCAKFNLESSDSKNPAAVIDPAAPTVYSVYPYSEKVGMINENWKHSAERTCFERTIDPELYPPTRKI